MLKVYISGKISGLDIEQAKAKFQEAEDYLKDTDFVEVINPMKLSEFDPNKTWKQYMIEDIDMLFDCDTIYMLDNWETSRGARIERAIAHEMQMKIIYQK